jgi:hypothetical protein
MKKNVDGKLMLMPGRRTTTIAAIIHKDRTTATPLLPQIWLDICDLGDMLSEESWWREE